MERLRPVRDADGDRPGHHTCRAGRDRLVHLPHRQWAPVVGTPEQIADDIERFFTGRAADGFNLNFDFFPDGLGLIVDQLVPELRRRGLFRTEYESRTLHGNLGLPPPTSAAKPRRRPHGVQQVGNR
nr:MULTISPECIES: hypothetical protein [Protofrankia]